MVGAGPFISVYCAGTAGAPHEKWRIGSLKHLNHEGVDLWSESLSGYADHTRDALFEVRPPLTQYLVGDKWLNDEEQSRHWDDHRFRTRWAFECQRCRFRWVCGQPARLSGRIDMLVALCDEDGILEIPVRAFVRHVMGDARGAHSAAQPGS